MKKILLKFPKFSILFLAIPIMINSTLFAKDENKKAFTINGKSTTLEQLEEENQGLFYDLEKRKFSKINSLAMEAYLKYFWDKEAKKQKTTAEIAEQKYLDKNVTVSDTEVKETLERFKDHPKLKDLSASEKEKQIRDTLKTRASRTIIDSIIQKGLASKELVINYPSPQEPRFNVSINKDDNVRYGPNTQDTKPQGCTTNDCPIVIVEYSEFQCPFCARVVDSTKKILSEYKGKLAWVTRDFPLSFHDRARPAAIAAHCASFQGKYWEMYHKLFDNQRKLSDTDFIDYAKQTGLNMTEFEKCTKSPDKANSLIDANFQSGAQLGVSGTPAFFINGRRLSGAVPYEDFKRIITEELISAKVQKDKKPNKL